MSENDSRILTEKLTDHTLPDEGVKWKFDEDVTSVFNDMLERSIPQYGIMRKAVFDIGRRYVKPQTSIIDLGCSRGEALAPFVKTFEMQNNYLGVEVSEPMLTAARQRFVHEIDMGYVDIKNLDLRLMYPGVNQSSVTLAVLSILFIPIEYRQTIISSAWKSLIEGGVFILVEKILGADAELSKTFIEIYLDMKREHGYSEEEIQRKKLALEGIQVPITAAWNEQMLRAAGFRSIDCFWRWFNFAGWIAIK